MSYFVARKFCCRGELCPPVLQRHTIKIKTIINDKSYNSNDKEIKRDSYDVDKLPENLIIDKSISYLVVLSKSEGNSYRQLCQRDDERVAVFTKFNESICTKEYIDIEWEDK